MTFSDRLNLLFNRNEKTLRSVADSIGTTAATLSRYLNGIHEPDYENIVKLCRYFNVSADWLCGLTDDSTRTLINDFSEVSQLYSIASEDDKKLVDLVLNKYKSNP